MHYFGGGRIGGTANYRAIRDSRWKLIVKAAGHGRIQPVELYDLGADPSEKFDRLKSHPDIAEKLLNEVSRFREEFSRTRRPLGRIGK